MNNGYTQERPVVAGPLPEQVRDEIASIVRCGGEVVSVAETEHGTVITYRLCQSHVLVVSE